MFCNFKQNETLYYNFLLGCVRMRNSSYLTIIELLLLFSISFSPDLELLKPFVSIRDCMQGKWRNLLPEIDIIPVNVEITTDIKPPVPQRKKKEYPDLVYKNPFDYSSMKKKKSKKKATSPPSSDDDKIEYAGNRRWSCMFCSEVTASKDDLIKHYEKHKEDEQEIEPREGSSSNTTEMFYCEVCSKEFTSLKSFERHTDLKHGEFLYGCDTCKKGFKNSFQFCLHNFQVHATDNRYHCNHCEFTTEDKADLKAHVILHKEDYKYRCDLCNRGFSVYSWFMEHENFHTGLTPFECEVCNGCFILKRDCKKGFWMALFNGNNEVHVT